MLHYHGTPITPRSELEKLSGHNFCVSFAYPNDAEWCLKNAQSIMWDNGAFSFFTKMKKVNWNHYYNFLEQKLFHPHWAVIPDVIDGDEEEQKETLAEWPFSKSFGYAVWHIGLSLDYLKFLVDIYPNVCFGSSGKYWKIGTDKWNQRIDAAFNLLEAERYQTRIHMLRAMSAASKGGWPFASADSTNVARNFKNKGKEKCAKMMMQAIDSKQPLCF